MGFLSKEIIFGVLRHVLGGVGMWLVGKEFVSEGDWAQVMSNIDTVIGSGMFLVATLLSIWNKYTTSKTLPAD